MSQSIDPVLALLAAHRWHRLAAVAKRAGGRLAVPCRTCSCDAIGSVEGPDLSEHAGPGHALVIVAYGPSGDPQNIALECEPCGVVICDRDVPAGVADRLPSPC